ncbi:MAG: M28 family peptidase [Anaerolineales bacterium]|nr:M28 family peptidase [Anaerolineales bacterium]
MSKRPGNLLLTAVVMLVSISCSLFQPQQPSAPEDDSRASGAPPVSETAGSAIAPDVSLEALLATLTDLTSIQPYSGWRNSASSGEREALDYMQSRLEKFVFLQQSGLTTERQTFNVVLGTEFHQTALEIELDNQRYEIPAASMRGPRDEFDQAVLFDSDGSLNDNNPDPVRVRAGVYPILETTDLAAANPEEINGNILLLNYELFDKVLLGVDQPAADLSNLINMQPAGIVFITQFSNKVGESHGTFIGDNSALNWIQVPDLPPVLYARMEDLSSANIEDWNDLGRISSAELVWDVDVRSPAESGNLAVFLPGKDHDRALFLGAHIDSPNSPGALDNGSGSAILLEILRYLNDSETIPPVDLAFVWFGSEEIGLYGSFHFAATHQEILDRALAMMTFDCLTRPLDGITAIHNIVGWSYARYGSPNLNWAEYLADLAGQNGIQTEVHDAPYIYSDNSAFTGYNLPNVNIIFQNEAAMNAVGQVWYAGHMHDPYDMPELAAESGVAFMEMAQLGIEAVLHPPEVRPNIEAVPEPVQRVVFAGSHNEMIHMSPSGFFDFNMLLGAHGLDVDHIPYGTPVSTESLAETAMVIVLPVDDYPASDEFAAYDESWTEEELDVLETYAREGGFLVITNSANRLKYANTVYEPNEDWLEMNALTERFGAVFEAIPDQGVSTSVSTGVSEFLPAAGRLKGANLNTLGIEVEAGTPLARLDDTPTVVLLEAGEGEVLILGDIGFLSADWGDLTNQPFWQNLAVHALE